MVNELAVFVTIVRKINYVMIPDQTHLFAVFDLADVDNDLDNQRSSNRVV